MFPWEFAPTATARTSRADGTHDDILGIDLASPVPSPGDTRVAGRGRGPHPVEDASRVAPEPATRAKGRGTAMVLSPASGPLVRAALQKRSSEPSPRASALFRALFAVDPSIAVEGVTAAPWEARCACATSGQLA